MVEVVVVIVVQPSMMQAWFVHCWLNADVPDIEFPVRQYPLTGKMEATQYMIPNNMFTLHSTVMLNGRASRPIPSGRDDTQRHRNIQTTSVATVTKASRCVMSAVELKPIRPNQGDTRLEKIAGALPETK